MIARFAFAFTILTSATAAAAVLNSWTEYAAGGALEARAITDGSDCPDLLIDAAPTRMAERRAPNEDFPIRLCRAIIPSTTKHAELVGLRLALPKARPQRIVVLGDSGCRLKGEAIQDCNDPEKWPFARVAAVAAASNPDLVIHVGDYNYRERACPQGDPRCAGTPHGDNWATWNADFFTPATPLLKAAPWIMIRGNHEDCRRAGMGWTFLLGSDPIIEACAAHERPRRIDLGGVTAEIFDDNDAEDTGNPAAADRLHGEILESLGGGPMWLMFHHPVRGIHSLSSGKDGATGANATLVSAFAGIDERPVQLILSGHIHTFQAESFEGGQAPQLIAGTGGDQLNSNVPPQFQHVPSGDTIVNKGVSDAEFGFVTMDRDQESWSIVLHGTNGSPRRKCRLADRNLSCVE